MDLNLLIIRYVKYKYRFDRDNRFRCRVLYEGIAGTGCQLIK